MDTPGIAEVMGRCVEARKRDDSEAALALWAHDISSWIDRNELARYPGSERHRDERGGVVGGVGEHVFGLFA
jgi:hypothetical protein